MYNFVMEKKFKIHSKYKPAGDQPKAIEELVEGINAGDDAQTLLGITGSGKTFTIANVIEIVLFTSIPIRVAAPLSSETASIACPAFVFLIKSIRATMITIQEIMVTIVSPVITI